MKKPLLMMDLGTLDKMVVFEQDIQKLRNFEGAKVILTGWDFSGHGRKYAEKYDVNAIVSESSILHKRPKEGWGKGEPERIALHTDEDIKLVKQINYKLIEKIYAKYRESVLLSQADEKSICYYINPPGRVIDDLQEFVVKEEIRAKRFREDLIGKWPKLSAGIDVISDKELKLPDNIDNRYLVEKVNARYRTFKPYRLRIIDKSIYVKLDATQKVEWKYEDVEEVVQGLWAKGLGVISAPEYIRITPQPDVCIDVFARTKIQTWRQAIAKAGLEEFTPIFYLSRETKSDIPLIVDGYSKENFYALASEKMPQQFRSMGVVEAKTITEALNFVNSKTEQNRR